MQNKHAIYTKFYFHFWSNQISSYANIIELFLIQVQYNPKLQDMSCLATLKILNFFLVEVKFVLQMLYPPANGAGLVVVYFDQLWGAAPTQKLVKLLFFSRFQHIEDILDILDYILKHRSLVIKLKKSSSTSFWVYAAPKSWSKYTTDG